VQYDIEVNGQRRQLTVTGRDGRFIVRLGEEEWSVDASHVAGHTLSLLIGNGEGLVVSREIPVATDPVSGQHLFGIGPVPVRVGLNVRRRFGRTDDAADGGSGPQRIVAPMPGKVVRIVGAVGDAVVHRQPVVVIEAMKMENEIRASSSAKIKSILVEPGQSIESGSVLIELETI